ncbi:MAG: phosphoribosylformylglycinamidine synthase subunit PurS, partial [Thermodesulfobacteriota bacterium]|nr:phosphoribosylformylglycinamidine synthase subunit PurS [Thermodesulfobacteriota bacterium]
MAHRIEVGFKPSVRDAWGEKIRKRIWEDLHYQVDRVQGIDIYTVDMDLSQDQLTLIAEGPLVDPIIQQYTIDKPLAGDFDWIVEVGFRPGVTDNVGRTAREAIELVLETKLKEEEKVFTSKQCLISGNLSRDEVEKIAGGLLANELIERFSIIHKNEWDASRGMAISVPRVTEADEGSEVTEIDLNVDDETLMKISQE